MKKILRATMMLVMALVANVAMAQTVVTFTAGTDKGEQGSVTGADKVSKEGVTIETSYGAFGAAQYRFGAKSNNTFTVTNGVITKIVLTCTAKDEAKYGPGHFTTTSGTYTFSGDEGTWTGEATTVELNNTGKQVRAKTLEITVASNDPNYVAAPVIDGEESFDETTTVTITAGEGTQVYYTVNGDDPTDDRAERTLYTAPFTLNQTTTVKAAAFKGEYTSATASKTFTKIATFTASEALAALTAGTQPTTVCYITGTICEDVDTTGIGQYGNLTYKISDDGTAANSLIVFRGKSFDGNRFTKDFYLKKGDQVKVLGLLINYTKDGVTTPEVQTSSELISVNGQTAGVNVIKNNTTDKNAPLYNLAGQRVSNDYKGVVIQNGKKFFNK